MNRHDSLIVDSASPSEPTPAPRKRGNVLVSTLAMALAASAPFSGELMSIGKRQRGRVGSLLERAPDAYLDQKAVDKRERRRLRNLRISGASPDNEQCPRLSPDHR